MYQDVDVVVGLLRQASDVAARATPSDDSRLVLDLLDMLASIIITYGPETAGTTLRLAPIALARGDSKRALDDWLARYEAGQRSNAVITIDRSRRHQVDVAFTGQVGLAGLSFSA